MAYLDIASKVCQNTVLNEIGGRDAEKRPDGLLRKKDEFHDKD